MSTRVRVRGPGDIDLVCVTLPDGNTSSHIIVPDGKSVAVDVDRNGHRTIPIPADQARLILNSGTSGSVPWWERNQELAAVLGAPRLAPGINIAHALSAATPRSTLELVADMRASVAELAAMLKGRTQQ
jgi:hypothetical protein